MNKYIKHILTIIEYYMFALIVLAIIVSNFSMLPVFFALDWGNIQTFVEALKVILFWIIGIEFARLLIEYRTEIVIELLIFIIARKLLLIEDDMILVSIGIITILILLLGRFWLSRFSGKTIRSCDSSTRKEP